MNKLIITSGDISDADCFISLADYAKNTDADILFIMNYPAYFNYPYEKIHEGTDDETFKNGFNYGLKEILKRDFNSNLDFYKLLNISNIDDQKNYDNFFYSYMFVSYSLINKIFNEAKKISGKRGNIFFKNGGINSFNFMSSSKIKNELILYKDYVITNIIFIPLISYEYKSILFQYEYNIEDYDKYQEIYFDMCGSVPFYKYKNIKNIFERFIRLKKLKGFYIMGGVLGNLEPNTMIPNIQNSINQQIATANQIYSHNEYIELLKLFNINKIPIFIIPNNSILEDDDINTHLISLFDNHINLLKICNIYYYNNKGKPFDYIVSRLICNHINDPNLYSNDIKEKQLILYYDINYGSSIIVNKIYNQDELLLINCFNNIREKDKFNFSIDNPINCFVYKIENANYSNKNDYLIYNKPILISGDLILG